MVVAFRNSRDELYSLARTLLRGSKSVGLCGSVVIVVNDEMEGWDQEGVVWVRPGSNAGFARGVAAGCAAGSADLVFFINPDCVVGALAIREMVSAVEASGGIAVPQLRNDDGAFGYEQYSNWVFSADRWTTTWLCRRLEGGDGVRQLPWYAKAPGACLAMRRQVAERLGGPFDDAFFLYGEDRDMTRRARRAAIPVVYVPGAEVIHSMGGSAEEGSAFVEYCRTDASLRIAFRRLGRIGARAYAVDQHARDLVRRRGGREAVAGRQCAVRRWANAGFVDPGRVSLDGRAREV